MLEHLTTELSATKKEIDRLVKNRSLFYEIMSDMVLILNNQYKIEDMNSIAINSFGDLRGTQCFKALHNKEKPCVKNCPIQLIGSKTKHDEYLEAKIAGLSVQYSFVPYKGYQGDELIMLIMRDVTILKRSKRTIHQFDTNLSHVLQQKIKGLKESEEVRKQLAQEVNVLKK